MQYHININKNEIFLRGGPKSADGTDRGGEECGDPTGTFS